MNIRNNSNSRIYISRGNISVNITPGCNNIPDYPWVATLVDKHPNLEYIVDVKFTETGTISDESKILNTEKAVTKRSRKAAQDD